MALLSTLYVLSLFSSILVYGGYITASDIDDLRHDLIYAFDTFGNVYDQPGAKPLIASTVRLVFHDCAGPINENGESDRLKAVINNDKRRCDGCIDMSNSDHGGLEWYAVKPLEEVYVDKGWYKKISGADFWMAAGNVAIEYSQSLSDADGYLPPLDYLFGRDVCSDDAPNAITTKGTYGTEFPLSHFGWNDMAEFMGKHFDFDTRNIVAIMGAHTLGRAHKDASGFEGVWTHNPYKFDNEYYRFLVAWDEQWHQGDDMMCGFPQWDSQYGDIFRLNVDICLLADMENDKKKPHGRGKTYLDKDSGRTTCRLPEYDGDGDYATCPEEVSWDDTFLFARDNQAFLKAFAHAWNKLLKNNQHGLYQVDANSFEDFIGSSSYSSSDSSSDSSSSDDSSDSSEYSDSSDSDSSTYESSSDSNSNNNGWTSSSDY